MKSPVSFLVRAAITGIGYPILIVVGAAAGCRITKLVGTYIIGTIGVLPEGSMVSKLINHQQAGQQIIVFTFRIAITGLVKTIAM